MSKKGIAILLSLILAGWIAFVSYWYVCKVKGHCLNKVEVTENLGNSDSSTTDLGESSVEKPTFSLSDGELFSISNDENLSFGNGTADVSIPDSLSIDFEKLAEYFNNNENKNLELSGYYTDTESLGLERVNTVKDHFVNNYNLNESRITTKTEQISELSKDDNNTYGAIGFEITELSNGTPEEVIEEEIVAEVKSEIVSESSHNGIDSRILKTVKKRFVMYYPPNKFYMNTTRAMDSYFNKLAKYFKQNPNGLIEIKGYSDYEGTDISLKSLGKEKASEVKNYLMKKYDINPRNLRVKGSSNQDLQYSDLDKAKNRKIVFNFIK